MTHFLMLILYPTYINNNNLGVTIALKENNTIIIQTNAQHAIGININLEVIVLCVVLPFRDVINV